MKYIFILFISAIYFTTFGQPKTDSLINILSKQKADTTQLKVLGQLVKAQLYSDVKKAKIYAKQYMTLAKKLKNQSEIARGHNFIGMTHHVSGEIDYALNYYLQALRQYEALQDSLYTGILMNNIAGCFQFRKDQTETIAYYEKSLAIFKKINNKQWIANVSFNLASQYSKSKNYSKALSMSRLALSSFTELKDTNSQGLTLTQIGTLLLDTQKSSEAITYFQKSIGLIDPAADPIALGINYENLGAAYTALKYYPKAESNLLNSIEIFSKHNSLEHLTKAYDAARQLYKNWGNFEKAYIYAERYQAANDSLFNRQKDQNVIDALKKYDLEKKEKEIKLLNTENELKNLKIKKAEKELIFYAIGLIILAAFAGIGIYLYQLKQKSNLELSHKNKLIESALAEKEILMQEIHHRVKNNLQVVSSLLNIQSRHLTDHQAIEAIKEGQNRVKTMGLIHQSLYQDHDMRAINLKKYLEKLTKNLFDSYNISPTKIALQTNIKSVNIDIDTIIPIGLILNELITNALKYAFPNNQSGIIEINCLDEDDSFTIEVNDNGIGLTQIFDIEQSKSMGYQIINSFVKKLQATISIINTKGTKVKITIPKLHNE